MFCSTFLQRSVLRVNAVTVLAVCSPHSCRVWCWPRSKKWRPRLLTSASERRARQEFSFTGAVLCATNSEPVLASKLLHVSTRFRSCVGNPTICRRWTQVSAALISKTRQQNSWTATRRGGQVLHSIFQFGFNWLFSMFQFFFESPIDGVWLQFEVAATK